MDQFDALARSATQRIYELTTFRAQLLQGTWELSGQAQQRKAIAAQELYSEWEKHVRTIQSKSGENVTLNFMETAMLVYEKILSHANLRDKVLNMDSARLTGSKALLRK